MTHWDLTLAGLRGEPWPMPAELPGVVHACRDEPLADEYLADVQDPRELARLCGISLKTATERLKASNPERNA